MRFELGLIGAGNMAEAIVKAAIESGIVPATSIVASDPSEARRALFAGMGIHVTESNDQVIQQSRQVLLAIKPQTLPQVGESLRAMDVEQQVVISIMAGIRAAAIEAAAGRPVRVIRVMPNTPLMVGCGMSGVAMGTYAKPGDESLTMRLFGAAGKAVLVDETQLDAITAVSGSGPAYVFYLAEAMQAAAEKLGLGEHAAMLVEHTIFGAAKLLRESSDTPAELRRKVTSPRGTTEAAINHMDGSGVNENIKKAVEAAWRRSIELGA